jgi:hypothetical protein
MLLLLNNPGGGGSGARSHTRGRGPSRDAAVERRARVHLAQPKLQQVAQRHHLLAQEGSFLWAEALPILDLVQLQLGGTQHRHARGDGLASRVELLVSHQAVYSAVEGHCPALDDAQSASLPASEEMRDAGHVTLDRQGNGKRGDK